MGQRKYTIWVGLSIVPLFVFSSPFYSLSISIPPPLLP
nr:MAG TPA: hypothetical protein [Caudoviricetes sp.]